MFPTVCNIHHSWNTPFPPYICSFWYLSYMLFSRPSSAATLPDSPLPRSYFSEWHSTFQISLMVCVAFYLNIIVFVVYDLFREDNIHDFVCPIMPSTIPCTSGYSLINEWVFEWHHWSLILNIPVRYISRSLYHETAGTQNSQVTWLKSQSKLVSNIRIQPRSDYL